MEVESLTFSFSVLQWIVSIAIGLYAWVIGRQSASAKDMIELRGRLIRLESEIQQVPTQKIVSELMARLERLDTHIQAQAQALQPINRQLERINDYLLKSK